MKVSVRTSLFLLAAGISGYSEPTLNRLVVFVILVALSLEKEENKKN